LSKSALPWSAFGVDGQLSTPSHTPSPSSSVAPWRTRWSQRRRCRRGRYPADRIRHSRAVVAGVADPVTVQIRLGGIGEERADVVAVIETVEVADSTRNRRMTTRAVRVRVLDRVLVAR
jgi:hypothetical protein